MIEQDTVKLLRECDAGVRMGISSIEDMAGRVKSRELSGCLARCRQEHQQLEREIRARLDRFHDKGKAPALMAQSMSKLKTGFRLGSDPSDQTVADLMTDGCNMGIKSLSRYLNQYRAADEISKDITKKLIRQEEALAIDLRRFL